MLCEQGMKAVGRLGVFSPLYGTAGREEASSVLDREGKCWVSFSEQLSPFIYILTHKTPVHGSKACFRWCSLAPCCCLVCNGRFTSDQNKTVPRSPEIRGTANPFYHEYVIIY